MGYDDSHQDDPPIRTNRYCRACSDDTYGVAKSQAAFVKAAVNQKIHNRLVLITCAERNGRDYDYNVIADAYLTSSVRASDKS